MYSYSSDTDVLDSSCSFAPWPSCSPNSPTYTGCLLGKPEGKRPLERPRPRWEDNIKMDLQEVECGRMDWIELAQDRDRWRALVNATLNLRITNMADIQSEHNCIYYSYRRYTSYQHLHVSASIDHLQVVLLLVIK